MSADAKPPTRVRLTRARLGGASQKFLNDLSVTATGRDPLSVSKNQHLVALIEWLRSADVRRVDDHRSMHSKKRRAGQARLEMAERLADIICGVGEMNACYIIARLDPVDLGWIQEQHFSVDSNGEAST